MKLIGMNQSMDSAMVDATTNSREKSKPIQVQDLTDLAVLAPDCASEFKLLQRHPAKYVYIIYKLNESGTEIVIDEKVDYSELYSSMIEKLPSQEPRWIAANIRYKLKNGGERSKVAIITWVPDTITRATLKESARVKMMALNYSGMLKKACKGWQYQIQANCIDLATLSNKLAGKNIIKILT